MQEIKKEQEELGARVKKPHEASQGMAMLPFVDRVMITIQDYLKNYTAMAAGGAAPPTAARSHIDGDVAGGEAIRIIHKVTEKKKDAAQADKKTAAVVAAAAGAAAAAAAMIPRKKKKATEEEEDDVKDKVRWVQIENILIDTVKQAFIGLLEQFNVRWNKKRARSESRTTNTHKFNFKAKLSILKQLIKKEFQD